MRNGRVINSQVARVTVVGGDLTINPAQLGDSGLYVCSAGNAVSLNYVNTYLDISRKNTLCHIKVYLQPRTYVISKINSSCFACKACCVNSVKSHVYLQVA